MIKIIRAFNNGFFDCLTIESDRNKKLIDKRTNEIFNGEVGIKKEFKEFFIESEEDNDEVDYESNISE